MTRFEGLNLAELMAQMHAIEVPEPVAFSPETIGWYVLGVWLLVSLIIVVIDRVMTYRRNRYRREALAAITQIESELPATEQAAAVATILKRAALTAYGRQVADLHGKHLADFFRQSAPAIGSLHDHADELASMAYVRQPDMAPLYAAARLWITRHVV